jgi:hypothetical protein
MPKRKKQAPSWRVPDELWERVEPLPPRYRKSKAVFFRLWKEALWEYDALEGIDWGWQSLDGAITKAPLGGGKTGPNPTDRAKSGTKHSLLTDGDGVPLALAVAGTNTHDKRLVEPP